MKSRTLEGKIIKHTGQPYYGYALGVVVIGNPVRIPGDQGNASTYDFPVKLKKVRARVEHGSIVIKGDPKMLKPIINAAKELENEGVKAISTTCGFTAMWQDQITSAVDAPAVITSSLIQVPLIYQMFKKRVGIITANASALGEKHLKGAGIDKSIPIAIAGLENEEGWKMKSNILDLDKVEGEMIKVAKKLVSENPDIGAIVLECANLPPYAAAVQEATGLPVFDVSTLTNMVVRAWFRKRFTGIL